MIQIDLSNNELMSNSLRVLGFVGAALLDLDVETWTFELIKEQISVCFAEWERCKKFE
jgi:hypothetical protein